MEKYNFTFFGKIKSRWREIELQKLSSDDEALMSGLEQRQEQTRVNYSAGILLNHSTCKKLLMAFLHKPGKAQAHNPKT